MSNKLGVVGTAATVAGIGLVACNPIGAGALIVGGIAAGMKSVEGDTSYRPSGGGWGSGEAWLPIGQYVLIWTGVTELVFSVILFGASLMCAPGCGVDAVSGFWTSVLLFVVGTVSTGAGFVYSGIFPDKTEDTEGAEQKLDAFLQAYQEKETLKQVNFNLLDFAPPPAPIVQSSAALAKPVRAVSPTAKPLDVPNSTLVSDDGGETWFIIIDTTESTVEAADKYSEVSR